jgi:hypothetical protein
MTVQFIRTGYQARYASGDIVTFPPSTEDSLIAGGWAITSAAVPNTNLAGSYRSGRAVIPAGQSTTTVVNPLVNAATSITAAISQSSADGTLTSIVRTIPSAGSFQIVGNGNATAAVQVAWDIGS